MPVIEVKRPQTDYGQLGQVVGQAVNPNAGVKELLPLLLQQQRFQAQQGQFQQELGLRKQALAQEKQIAKDKTLMDKLTYKMKQVELREGILKDVEASPDTADEIYERYADFPEEVEQVKKIRKLREKQEKQAETREFSQFVLQRLPFLKGLPGAVKGASMRAGARSAGLQIPPGGGPARFPDILQPKTRERLEQRGTQLPLPIVPQDDLVTKWRGKISEWLGQ